MNDYSNPSAINLDPMQFVKGLRTFGAQDNNTLINSNLMQPDQMFPQALQPQQELVSITPQTGVSNDWMSSLNKFLFGSENNGVKTMGAAMPLLGLGSGLLQGYLGMKQYGLAKDALAQQQQNFALNYDAQRRLTNAELRDRQARRVREDPGAMSVEEYMAKNGLKPRS